MQCLGIKREALSRVAVFSTILSLNMLAFQIADVVATAGFLKAVGTQSLLWLWAGTLLVSLVTTTVVGGLSDQLPRRKMLMYLVAIILGLDVLVGVLYVMSVASSAVYGVLYFVADQQYFLVPMIFWVLANDVFPSAERKRAFPLVASGSVIAQIAGNAIVYGVSLKGTGIEGIHLLWLLAISGLSLGAGLALIVRKVDSPGEGGRTAASLIEGTLATTKMVRDYWRNLPIVRYLAFVTLVMEFVLLVIQYHFLQVVNATFGLNSLARVLSLFTTATIGVTTALQWFLTGRLLERVGLKQSFFVLPAMGVLSGILGGVWSGLAGAGGGQFVLQITRWAWDHPSHAAFQGMLPEQRRGRITAFADSYVSTLGSLLACLVLGLVSSLAGVHGAAWMTAGLTLVASSTALWASWRFRSAYDTSLLNWRMGRPKRRSVLDQLDL